MTDEEIKRIVEPILRRHLGPFGFETAEVVSGADPAIFVSAHYATAEPERAALWENGEARIAYGGHLFPETEVRR